MRPPSVLERAARPFRGISAEVFATLSRLRGHRIFHPYGEAFTADVVFERSADRWLPAVLARPRRHDAIVRFSRAVGLPDALPDLLGMAVKIPGLYGEGYDQDWLLVTSGADPVSRHLLIPALDVLGRPYSTVLPYRRPSGLVTFGAQAAHGQRARSIDRLREMVRSSSVTFDFTIAPEGADHVRIGHVHLRSDAVTSGQALRFNPWNTSSELRPAGALNDLRRDTYIASQRARPDAQV